MLDLTPNGSTTTTANIASHQHQVPSEPAELTEYRVKATHAVDVQQRTLAERKSSHRVQILESKG